MNQQHYSIIELSLLFLTLRYSFKGRAKYVFDYRTHECHDSTITTEDISVPLLWNLYCIENWEMAGYSNLVLY